MTARFILNADDYGLSAGVSRAICELIEARRLSSTSAIVTLPRWRDDATALRDFCDRSAIGLHLNLTLGAPLGPMPKLASVGVFPGIAKLALQAAAIDASAELEAEIERQFDAFENAIGAPPDFVDGHHHAHALPGVRAALLASLKRRGPGRRLFLRDPADALARIGSRGVAISKAAGVAALARGFGAAARAAGFQTNDGFSGFAAQRGGADGVASDFTAAATHLGPRHLIMCHPGFADDELADLDPLTHRRDAEVQVLMRDAAFAAQIWRPVREKDGHVAWPQHFDIEAAA